MYMGMAILIEDMTFENYLSMGIETSTPISIHNISIHKYMYTKTHFIHICITVTNSFIETKEILYKDFIVAEL